MCQGKLLHPAAFSTSVFPFLDFEATHSITMDVLVSNTKPDVTKAVPRREDEVCNTKSVAFGATSGLKCVQKRVGRYLIVTLSNTGKDLALCEVQVFGAPRK
jgi:hypothetical protein